MQEADRPRPLLAPQLSSRRLAEPPNGIGVEYSTYTIIGRCERTGMFGVGIATRDYAVGSRCPYVRAHVGALSTQAYTDPRLGHLGMNLLALGYSAAKVVAEIQSSDPHIEYRQIGVIDRDGNSAAWTGKQNKDWAGHFTERNVIAMGNHLTSVRTAEVMIETFHATADLELDERLMCAIEAGRDVGGQVGGQRSAALIIHHREAFPWVDLRVDAHDEPVGELRRVFNIFKEYKEHITLRATDPGRQGPTG